MQNNSGLSPKLNTWFSPTGDNNKTFKDNNKNFKDNIKTNKYFKDNNKTSSLTLAYHQGIIIKPMNTIKHIITYSFTNGTS
jgi:hypothetical protein